MGNKDLSASPLSGSVYASIPYTDPREEETVTWCVRIPLKHKTMYKRMTPRQKALVKLAVPAIIESIIAGTQQQQQGPVIINMNMNINMAEAKAEAKAEARSSVSIRLESRLEDLVGGLEELDARLERLESLLRLALKNLEENHPILARGKLQDALKHTRVAKTGARKAIELAEELRGLVSSN